MRCADCRAFVPNKSSRVGDGVCHLIPPTPIFMGFMQSQPIPGLLSGKNLPPQPILQPVRPSMAPDDFCMQFQPRQDVPAPVVHDTSEHYAEVQALADAATEALAGKDRQFLRDMTDLELQETADGAFGDGPGRRGAARDELNRRKAEKPSE